MFSQLQDRLEGVFKTLRGHGKLSERNVGDAMREIRMALLEADVDFAVAKALIAKVQEESMGEKVLKSVTPGQQVVKIFHDALVEVLGTDRVPLDLNPPARILMVGLNGAGKTTSSAKLAAWLKNRDVARSWWPATSNARPPSTSWRCSAARSACPCSGLKAARPTCSKWPRTRSPGPPSSRARP
jgi:signal recognition particle GTPase